MKIVPLNCPNCGKRLEIGENKEQLACGTCGSQLYVDRSGGTISLELAKSLGAISTGAAQTAAELALVRLQKELVSALSEVRSLDNNIEREYQNLANITQYFKEQDIMSETAVATANERLKTLEVENAQAGDGFSFFIASAVIIFLIYLFAVYLFAVYHLGSMWWLIPFSFVALCLMVGANSITKSIAGSRKDQLKKSLEEAKGRILLHDLAVKCREQLEEGTFRICRSRELIPNAYASVARIKAEIAHNKKIVS